jgi:hypothetical protein
LLAIAVATGCNLTSFDPHVADDETPRPGLDDGSGASCDADADCPSGEACVTGTCQVSRCVDDGAELDAPLPGSSVLAADREIAVVAEDGGRLSLRAYGPSDAAAVGPIGHEVDLGAPATATLAAGDLLGAGADVVAVAAGGAVRLVRGGDEVGRLEPGFAVAALAVGQADDDEADELTAIGAAGELARCEVGAGCARLDALTGVEVVAATAADLDDDGRDEILVLVADETLGTALRVLGADGAERFAIATVPAFAFDAADLDGDGAVELLLLADGGWGGLRGDRLHVVDLSPDGVLTELAVAVVAGDALDARVVALTPGEPARVALLRDGGRVLDLYAWDGAALTAAALVRTAAAGARLLALDVDGDSQRGRLVDAPALAQGPLVPTAVLFLPPYDREHSDGVSAVSLGDEFSGGTIDIETVSLSASVEVGVDARLLGLFSASIGGGVERGLSRSRTLSRRVRIGRGNRVRAEPEAFGYQYGAVVLSCACFRQYTYEVFTRERDAAEADGRFTILVPVGGSTTLWSTTRYNAKAEAAGFPRIETPHVIGDPRTYPRRPETIDGEAIAADDLVFPPTAPLLVSDAGEVGFSLAVGTSETNTEATRVGLSGSFGFSVGGGYVRARLGRDVDQRHSIELGSGTTFAGQVPALPDLPATPDDEYAAFGYAYQPVVYRQWYVGADGEPAAFYVATYAVP